MVLITKKNGWWGWWGGGGTRWSITGTLSDQTDLQEELDMKANIAALGNYYTKTQIDQAQNLFIWDTEPTVSVDSLRIDTTWWNYSFNLVTP